MLMRLVMWEMLRAETLSDYSDHLADVKGRDYSDYTETHLEHMRTTFNN